MAQAIARFRARAGDYAKQFGFNGYTVREVNVGTADPMIVQPDDASAHGGQRGGR